MARAAATSFESAENTRLRGSPGATPRPAPRVEWLPPPRVRPFRRLRPRGSPGANSPTSSDEIRPNQNAKRRARPGGVGRNSAYRHATGKPGSSLSEGEDAESGNPPERTRSARTARPRMQSTRGWPKCTFPDCPEVYRVCPEVYSYMAEMDVSGLPRSDPLSVFVPRSSP